MTMNYFVHSLMYTYFALRAMRVRVPKVVAMIITSLQLLQMVVGCAVNYFAFKFKESGRPCAVSDNNLFYSALMYFSYFLLFARFFYKAYFCKSERKSLEKVEPQLNGTPVSFGSVLQAGGKCSKDDKSPDKRSTSEESTDGSIVPTKEKETLKQTEEGKGVNLTEEKHPSALADDETDAVPTDERPNPEDEKEKDVITNPEEKINSPQIVNIGTEPAKNDKGSIGSAQISKEVTLSEEDQNRTSMQTDTFDQNSTGSTEPDTESKKDK